VVDVLALREALLGQPLQELAEGGVARGLELRAVDDADGIDRRRARDVRARDGQLLRGGGGSGEQERERLAHLRMVPRARDRAMVESCPRPPRCCWRSPEASSAWSSSACSCARSGTG